MMNNAIIALLLSFSTTIASAHDLWLVPPETAKPGEPATLKAVSGDKFPKGESAPDPSLFLSRIGRDPEMKNAELEAMGKDENSGLLSFKPSKLGVYAFGVQTKPKVLAMSAQKFNEYLICDGLTHIYKLRAKENTLGEDSKERYSKSPKALVCIGDNSIGDPCLPLGLTLEIVLKQNPFKKKPGDALKVSVLFEGKPLRGAHLGWDHPEGADEPAGTVVADADGEALIPLAKAGLMTIRLTHMTRPKNGEYEWESFWTTLTFRLPD